MHRNVMPHFFDPNDVRRPFGFGSPFIGGFGVPFLGGLAIGSLIGDYPFYPPYPYYYPYGGYWY